MTIFALYIVNKAGGLIFQQDYAYNVSGSSNKTINTHLRLASTFHGLHAIIGNLSPVPIKSGIESIETNSFRLQCYLTLTGVKFFLIASLETSDLERRLLKCYEFYSDYVMKNPFYELDMPIKCDLFEQNVNAYVKDQNGY